MCAWRKWWNSLTLNKLDICLINYWPLSIAYFMCQSGHMTAHWNISEGRKFVAHPWWHSIWESFIDFSFQITVHSELFRKKTSSSDQNSPDIEPNSLEWLLLLKFELLLLLLLLLSIDGATLLWADFSITSWSSLQYNDPPSRKANSSPATQNGEEQMKWLLLNRHVEHWNDESGGSHSNTCTFRVAFDTPKTLFESFPNGMLTVLTWY